MGAALVEGGDDTDDQGMREEEKSEAFEFRSLLEQRQRNLADVAAVEVVVGTCVYYYLSAAGHDARSRIWSSAS